MNYEIRLARKDDLKSLAVMHKKNYSKIHFSSYLSLNLIEKYYSYFIDSVNSQIFIIIDKDEILGFVVCGKDINRQLNLFKKEQFFKILQTIAMHPFAFFRKFSIDVFNKLFKIKIESIESNFLILSIVSSGREKGIGSLLLGHIKNYGLKNNIEKIGLYVRVENIQALNAYLKNGYKIMGYISDQYYMEQEICN
ncbi:GNAT family N-acetyltransferase [Campylobacter geochelonis]|nr:GNAT family N-acetyltransferase [Campylobacter geochelonis]CZE49302.1 ribosomal-protein-alanine acetyltransferase [Campylobacter geochelonis]CZE51416.1 ribosomal-protein-alanine acetyltransferase [Campylobacter geochelonis]